jgi:hypothetical protein
MACCGWLTGKVLDCFEQCISLYLHFIPENGESTFLWNIGIYPSPHGFTTHHHENLISQTSIVQGVWKVTQPIPEICSICQKINYTEVRKQQQQKKTMSYYVLGISTMSKLSSCNNEGWSEEFLSCMLPVSQKQFTIWDTVNLFGREDSGNVSINSFWKFK